MKSSVELENINGIYYPSFILNREDDYEYQLILEYLNILKRDLKRLIYYIEDTKKGVFKDNLINYLNDIRDSILVNVSEIIECYDSEVLCDLDSLSLKVTNDYVLFTVYLKNYDYSESKDIYPLIVLISRKLKNMEFYFLEKRESINPYVDDYFLTYFELEKNNVHMRGSYIKDYSFLDDYVSINVDKCVLELKKYQR